MSYQDFLIRKLQVIRYPGIHADVSGYGMFPHQIDLTKWALRRGRAAIFADTGLGKSRMQIVWANAVVSNTRGNVLILAPLAVAEQTVEEAAKIGIHITHAKDQADIRPGINITNYERIHRFETDGFTGVVLDESSIIKHHTAKTLQLLLDAFRSTTYKLACTATPSPNDWTELGNHAEFLGICSRAEMLAEYFVHDGGETQKWRLKGHAQQPFWRWVASWGCMIRSPSDLGHDASLYDLPPLTVHQHIIEVPNDNPFELLPQEAQTLSDRRNARRQSMTDRVSECARIVNSDRESWVVWCDLNAEGDALAASIDGAIQIAGADSTEIKEKRLHDFAHGHARVLVSKPSICGFGLNWQHCKNMAFVGVTDSFEAYYQAIRRCWRFGQTRPVDVHVFSSDREGAVVANLKRKEADAKAMGEAMSRETLDAVRTEIFGNTRETNTHHAIKPIQIPSFLETLSCSA